ncbi:MAG: DVUA0089 family protein [Oscillatoriaceae bacterium SKW80]|nr:DVUA0089 family protein [Oscillatoriaceae bacterium SKYG93]MCX8122293.1 DVUA0089 family protein [Oscillatoriaceae bacterium SKW80]MDW8452508.1 DVUA0089 family protein [Oscillatoriaceae cyanobacterium SKYGB_i_bin93]HIK29646.1 DVUA0089 family protein [Oscillatoriaceae cyanobacterium M7585_C2015_266]
MNTPPIIKFIATNQFSNSGFQLLNFVCLVVALSKIGFLSSVSAQIIPDSTLPNLTTVTPNGNISVIQGGTLVGGNLFHSFREFSVNNGSEVFFNNSADVVNIISRVTGGKVSNIDGLIRANGTANLFLINPSGIIFGPRASLHLGGSFFASTASGIRFADGSIFSATNPQSPPLLTVNLPIGLKYENNPVDITVQQSRLQVSPNNTLAIFGGNVNINGGILSAASGQVVLGGLVAGGELGISGLVPSFPEGIRGNIFIRNGAILDVMGNGGGSISILANNLELSGGSQVLGGIAANNQQVSAAGDISINANGKIIIAEKSAIANTVESKAAGNGGNIVVTSDALVLTSGSRISTITRSHGFAGNIQLNANSIDISGFSDDGIFSGILSYSENNDSGATGNITINQSERPHGNLRLANRGFLATVTKSINNSGSIEINVNNLNIESGGQIITLTENRGKAGEITVNATGKMSIAGGSTDFINSPFLDVTVYNLDDLPYSTDLNPNVEASGADGIPYISIQRTPEKIIAGNTILGTANQQFDYYSFTVSAPSRVIIDIDGGDGYEAIPGSLDTKITLFNRANGEALAINDDANIQKGAGGSRVVQDSYISTTLPPGNYVIGVGEFDTIPDSVQLLEGDRIDPGDTYTLNLSVQNRGKSSPLTTNSFNPKNFNPNYGYRSGLFSLTRALGNTGNLNINAAHLQLQSGGEIIATTFADGMAQNIFLKGLTVDINNARIANITRGSGNSGSIFMNADTINITNGSGLNLSNFGDGNTGDVRINTRNINFLEGGKIILGTYNRGNTGRVVINAEETVRLDGELEAEGSRIFNIVAGASSVGNAGGIEINTGSLSVTNGAALNTNTYGKGNAGNIEINARESVILDGRSSTGLGSSLLSRVRGRGVGNAGNININTRFFSMSNGTQLFNRTEGKGNAGIVNINANEISLNNSTISSSVESTAIGNGGTLNLNTERLSLSNGAKIIASTSGQGDAGQIFIRARELLSLDNSQISTKVNPQGIGAGGSIQIDTGSLILNNQSLITAETASGRGGNIRMQMNKLLLMRRHSQITATAGILGKGGDGGNIEINAPLIVGIPIENNDLTANAFEGRGGNIQLSAEGILGLEFRDRLTPLSDITASSQFGISGNVTISKPTVNPTSGLVKLPEEVANPSDKIIIGCAAAAGNSFTVTGRGGLPESPTSIITLMSEPAVWQDFEDFSNSSAAAGGGANTVELPLENDNVAKRAFVEATGFSINAKGKIELVSRRGLLRILPLCR